MPAYKIASGDLTNTPLLRHVAEIGKPMIFSTGGGTLDDVRRAYETLAAEQRPGRGPPVHGRLPGRVGRARPARDRDLPRAVPRRGRRLLEPRQRDRDGGRRLRARRAHRREALHAQPGDEGHRPRLLARAAGPAQDGARPAADAASRSATATKTVHPSEVAPATKMGKKLVAARDLPAGHVLGARRRRAEVAGRRPAAVRARARARPRAARMPLDEDDALALRAARGALPDQEPSSAVAGS